MTAAATARRPLGDDRGSGTVLVVGVIGLVVTLLAGVLVLGGVVRARHRAESAADLAALAGAASLQRRGPGAACTRAVEIAAANGARAACDVDGQDVLVVARVRLPPPAGHLAADDSAVARARAGPPR